jgi:hypothetical protein
MHADRPGVRGYSKVVRQVGVAHTHPSAKSSLPPGWVTRNGAARLMITSAEGIGGIVSRGYGGVPAR